MSLKTLPSAHKIAPGVLPGLFTNSLGQNTNFRNFAGMPSSMEEKASRLGEYVDLLPPASEGINLLKF